MWELRTDNGPRKLICSSIGAKDRCKICGQHFKKGDEQYLVVCNSSEEARKAKIGNFMSHVACWDAFCVGVVSDAEMVKKLLRHKQPKEAPLSDKQNEHINAFVQAAAEYGYRERSKTRQGEIRLTKRGTTQSVLYNPHSCEVSYEDRKKDVLFKGLFDRQIVANVYNKMHSILGDGKHDSYSALGVLNQAVEETNKFFGK